MATPGLVYLPSGKTTLQPGDSTTPVWDIVGDGSGGYIPAVAIIAPGSGKIVTVNGAEVWDINGDGSGGYLPVSASVV